MRCSSATSSTMLVVGATPCCRCTQWTRRCSSNIFLRADCGADVGRAFGHDSTRNLVIRGMQDFIFDELFNVVSCTRCPLLSAREGFHIVRHGPRLIARLHIHVQEQFRQGRCQCPLRLYGHRPCTPCLAVGLRSSYCAGIPQQLQAERCPLLQEFLESGRHAGRPVATGRRPRRRCGACTRHVACTHISAFMPSACIAL